MKKIVAIILIVLLSFECIACRSPVEQKQKESATDTTYEESTTIATEESKQKPATVSELASELSDLFSSEKIDGGKILIDNTEDSIIVNSVVDYDSFVEGLIQFPDPDYFAEDWNSLLGSINLYEAIKSYVRILGFNNINIIQNVVGENSGTIYATYTNGEITYNILDDIKRTASTKTALTVADLAAVLSDTLKNSTEHGNCWTVDYTEDSIIINFSMEGLDSVVDGMSVDYDTYIGYWNSFVNEEAFMPLYEKVKNSIEQFGFNNINIIQNILSDDRSRVYATYTNDKLTYNIADEVSGANVQWYAAGMYKVGVDIPAGEYFIQKEGTLSAYMAVYSDSTGDSILENENFNTFHFITVEDGQYFEVSRGKFTSVDNISLTYDPQNLTEGMYRVGIDIPAGEYCLECTSSYSGYVCVYPTSRSDRRIITNTLL